MAWFVQLSGIKALGILVTFTSFQNQKISLGVAAEF